MTNHETYSDDSTKLYTNKIPSDIKGMGGQILQLKHTRPFASTP